MVYTYPPHYQGFVKAVDRGVFKNESLGPYFLDVRQRAKYFQSPVKSQETVQSSGLSTPELGVSVNAFMERGLKNRKVLPLEDLVGIEDEFSVVFVENDPKIPRVIRLVSYQTPVPSLGIRTDLLMAGLLQLEGYNETQNHFRILGTYTALINNEKIENKDGSNSELAAIDLVNSASTVIEQLVFMEEEGFLNGIRKINKSHPI